MYRTAVITDEISQELKTASRLAASFGVQALEIRSVNEKNPFEQTQADVKENARIARDFGLSVCAVASPLFKCDIGDEAAYRTHVEGAARVMDAALTYGARLVRGFTFWNRGAGEADFDRIIDLYTPVVKLAEQRGVTVVLESEPSVATSNIELLSRFLKRMACPAVAALYDAGNEIADLDAPPPYPDGYEKLKPYIRHVHLKDMKRVAGGFAPAMLGEGDVDFHGVIGRLKRDGYNGFVSVETHYRMRTEQLDDELLVRPQGAAFSEGGLAATSAYLAALRDKYRWMEGRT